MTEESRAKTMRVVGIVVLLLFLIGIICAIREIYRTSVIKEVVTHEAIKAVVKNKLANSQSNYNNNASNSNVGYIPPSSTVCEKYQILDLSNSGIMEVTFLNVNFNINDTILLYYTRTKREDKFTYVYNYADSCKVIRGLAKAN